MDPSSGNFEGLSPSVFKKLQKEYQESLPQKINAMKKALKEKNFEELRFIVHKLAGNAATFGYPKISAICKAWDLLLSQKPHQDDLMKKMEAFMQEVEKEVK